MKWLLEYRGFKVEFGDPQTIDGKLSIVGTIWDMRIDPLSMWSIFASQVFYAEKSIFEYTFHSIVDALLQFEGTEVVNETKATY